ncbi:MAG: response regulator transcription factor [Chloroflexota bacterium]
MSERTLSHGGSDQPLTVLIVDGSASERRMLSYVVRAQGWRVVETAYGQAAVDMVRSQSPGLVLLEAALPDMDGLGVCRCIREFSVVPIIMVTSRRAESDKVTGLACGADDYVVKPYSPSELAARMRAVVKRSGGMCGKQ